MKERLQRYSEFKPTPYDSRGLNLPDQQDWFVLPTTQTRDSDVVDRSNFRTALELMGGESETVEVHRFGHWACGWFEIIIIHPSLYDKAVAEIVDPLESYPVLDEDDMSQLEFEESADE